MIWSSSFSRSRSSGGRPAWSAWSGGRQRPGKVFAAVLAVLAAAALFAALAATEPVIVVTKEAEQGLQPVVLIVPEAEV